MRVIVCGTILALCSICFQTEVHVEENKNITLISSTNNSSSFEIGIWTRSTNQSCSVLRNCSRTCTPKSTTMALKCSAGQINNTLLNVTRQNQGERWNCQFFYLGGGSSWSNFTIIVIVPILSVNITEPIRSQLTVIENIEVSFLCETSLGFPAATIKWYTDTTSIDNNITTLNINDTDSYLIQTQSTLVIIPKRTDTYKTIVCIANNTENNRTSTAKTISGVHYRVSIPTFKANNTSLNGTDLKVIVGSQLNVQCVSDGNPSPNISWKHPDTTVNTNGSFVMFHNVREQDNGTYICNATNTMTSMNAVEVSSKNSRLNVEVLVPTTKPLFYFRSDQGIKRITDNVLYILREDNTFAIECNSSGNPTPDCMLNVTNNCVFEVSNDVLNDSYIECNTRNTMNTTLSGVEYRRNSSILSIITMFPPEKPRFVCMNITFSESKLRVIATSNITLKCVSDSYPPPSYIWKSIDNQSTLNETLTLTSISVEEHGNMLTCIAKNTMNVSFGETYYTNSTASLVLDVLYSPTIPVLRINDVTLDDSINVVRGDNVTINCTAAGNPAPAHAWQYNGRKNGPVLHLENIRSNVTHICEANNTLQPTCFPPREEKSNRSLSIVVQHPPDNITIEVISESDSVKYNENRTHIRVLKGLTFNLYCFAQSSPAPNKIEWTRNNTEETYTHMEFVNITENSTGIYTCIARNKMVRTVGSAVNGIGNKSIILLVISTDKPEAPSDVKAVKSSASAITVEWKPGLPGSSPQHFVVSYRTQNSEDWTKEIVNDIESESNSRALRYTIQNLVSDTKYYIQVLSQNNFGTSNSTTMIVTTAKVVHFNTPLNIAAIVGGTIAGVIVLCGSIVFIFVCRKRVQKKTSDNQLSTGTPATSSSVYENVKNDIRPMVQQELSPLVVQSERDVYENAVFSKPMSQTSNGKTAVKNGEKCVNSSKKSRSQQQSKLQQELPMRAALPDKKGTTQQSDAPPPIPAEADFENLLSNVDGDDDQLNKYALSNGENVYNNSAEKIERIENVFVHELYDFVAGKSHESFATEFYALPKGLIKPCTVAVKPENIKLNRYNGIFPYDHSRVTIPEDPDFFTNACYMDGYKKEKCYIASLGPTSDTSKAFKTFWRMVWHEQSDIIAMVTNLREITGMKCEQYWPKFETSIVYGEVTVTCKNVETYAEYTVRTFNVSHANNSRIVTQLHFTAWPDKGVPDDLTSLLEFRQRINYTPSNKTGPVIVHCSAGIGRTGTLIALDRLIMEGKAQKYINVSTCVDSMRQQRVNMVQTLEQYIYIYKACVYALEFECDSISAEIFHDTFKATTDAQFAELFKTLETMVDNESEIERKAILDNKQDHSNRPNADITGDKYRVRLYIDKNSDDPDYTNAVYINSFKTRNRFIAAQTPLRDFVQDFLCVVFQEQCICVVDMDGKTPTKGDVGIYLPSGKQYATFGNFTISCDTLDSNQKYTVSKMKIENIGKFYKGEWTCYHFKYHDWKHGKETPGNAKDFVDLLKEVDEYANQFGKQESQVMIHCLDGSTRSGLFCFVACLLEKIQCERQVNVGNTLRQVRTRRKTTIRNANQLKFCYKAVDALIEMNKAK